MKTNCDFCGAIINDYDERCSNCGGVNNHYRTKDDGIPSTISELKQFYIDHKLPPEKVTRFFIGKNTLEPKAFGIYKNSENNNFVVYKNDASGNRFVRYDGADEDYATKELYYKLREVMAANGVK